MKVKIFDGVLHNVPAGKLPATYLEDQINSFLKHCRVITIPSERSGTPRVSKSSDERQDTMGDKSPKAVNKHATQKQAKAHSDLEKRKQAIAAKQVAGKRG